MKLVDCNRFAAIGTATILVAIAAGCSNPKDPSKENFAKAVDAYYANSPLCIPLPHQARAFPVKVDVSKYDDGASTLHALKPFIEAGLMKDSVSKAEAEIKPLFGQPHMETVDRHEITLTDVGQAAHKMEDGFIGKQAAVCYAKRKVAEVTDFSAPSQMGGYTVSNVNVKAKIYDVAPWAKSGPLADAFKRMIVQDDIRPERATVVLMDSGWVDGRMVKS